MKDLTILITTILFLMLSACVTTDQVKDGTEISVNAYIANDAVDVVQSTIGQYSVNQDTLKKLDELQSDISEALKGGDAILEINSFYQRGVDIYTVLNAEAVEREAELTPLQQEMLNVLNKTIISLDRKIKNFKADENNTGIVESVGSMIEAIGTVKTILTLYNVGTVL